jgi:3-phosphoshikimate 1-carboxyvinyltransferase
MSDKLAIEPFRLIAYGGVRVPGSKSITNRALVLAALTARSQPCTLVNALHSEDTEVMVDCLRKLGFSVRPDWDADPPTVTVGPTPGDRVIPATSADLFVGNSGTTMRFLTAMVSLGEGQYRLAGVPRMHERPIEDLLDALRQLGVTAMSETGNGCPPVRIHSTGWQPRSVITVNGAVSSQFLSGLMLAAPFAARDTMVMFDENLVSRPYLDMTEAMLRAWGLAVRFRDRTRTFKIPGRQTASFASYDVEGDASAASYFFAAAAIRGGRVLVWGLPEPSLQGDVRFLDVLERMGCYKIRQTDGWTLQSNVLRGIDVDMNAISDTVMTLAAVACFAEGPTTIRNVAHVRHKETDRLAALATELRRVGAGVEEFADGLTITPRPLHGAEIETYNDHRMAMSMALIGLRVPGIVIKNPGCVAKTYPGFFADLEKLRVKFPPDRDTSDTQESPR